MLQRAVALSSARPSSSRALPAWAALPATLPQQLRLRPLNALRFGSTETLSPAQAEVARVLGAFEEAKESCSDTFEPEMGDDGVLWLNLGDCASAHTSAN